MKYEHLLNAAYSGEKFETLKSGNILLELEKRFKEHPDRVRMLQLIDCLTDSLLLVPMNATTKKKNMDIMKNVKIGDIVTLEDDLKFTPFFLQDGDGRLFIPIFSQEEQIDKNYFKSFSVLWMHISEIIEMFKHSKKELEGIILDPQKNQIVFSKELINIIEDIMEIKEKELKTKTSGDE